VAVAATLSGDARVEAEIAALETVFQSDIASGMLILLGDDLRSLRTRRLKTPAQVAELAKLEAFFHSDTTHGYRTLRASLALLPKKIRDEDRICLALASQFAQLFPAVGMVLADGSSAFIPPFVSLTQAGLSFYFTDPDQARIFASAVRDSLCVPLPVRPIVMVERSLPESDVAALPADKQAAVRSTFGGVSGKSTVDIPHRYVGQLLHLAQYHPYRIALVLENLYGAAGLDYAQCLTQDLCAAALRAPALAVVTGPLPVQLSSVSRVPLPGTGDDLVAVTVRGRPAVSAAMSHPSREPAHVVVILDDSASMSGPKMAAANRALQQLGGRLPSGTLVTIQPLNAPTVVYRMPVRPEFGFPGLPGGDLPPVLPIAIGADADTVMIQEFSRAMGVPHAFVPVEEGRPGEGTRVHPAVAAAELDTAMTSAVGLALQMMGRVPQVFVGVAGSSAAGMSVVRGAVERNVFDGTERTVLMRVPQGTGPLQVAVAVSAEHSTVQAVTPQLTTSDEAQAIITSYATEQLMQIRQDYAAKAAVLKGQDRGVALGRGGRGRLPAPVTPALGSAEQQAQFEALRAATMVKLTELQHMLSSSAAPQQAEIALVLSGVREDALTKPADERIVPTPAAVAAFTQGCYLKPAAPLAPVPRPPPPRDVFDCIWADDFKAARSMIARGEVGLGAKDPRGATPLISAVCRWDALQKQVESSARIGKSMQNCLAFIKVLIKQSTADDICAQDNTGNTAAHRAIWYGNVAVTMALLRRARQLGCLPRLRGLTHQILCARNDVGVTHTHTAEGIRVAGGQVLHMVAAVLGCRLMSEFEAAYAVIARDIIVMADRIGLSQEVIEAIGCAGVLSSVVSVVDSGLDDIIRPSYQRALTAFERMCEWTAFSDVMVPYLDPQQQTEYNYLLTVYGKYLDGYGYNVRNWFSAAPLHRMRAFVVSCQAFLVTRPLETDKSTDPDCVFVTQLIQDLNAVLEERDPTQLIIKLNTLQQVLTDRRAAGLASDSAGFAGSALGQLLNRAVETVTQYRAYVEAELQQLGEQASMVPPPPAVVVLPPHHPPARPVPPPPAVVILPQPRPPAERPVPPPHEPGFFKRLAVGFGEFLQRIGLQRLGQWFIDLGTDRPGTATDGAAAGAGSGHDDSHTHRRRGGGSGSHTHDLTSRPAPFLPSRGGRRNSSDSSTQGTDVASGMEVRDERPGSSRPGDPYQPS
jgi:hypothetical protein